MFQTLCVIVTSLLLAFLFLELSVRTYLMRFAKQNRFMRFASFTQLSKRYPPRYSLHRYIGYYPTPNYRHGKNQHNSLGYRGEEFPQPKPEGEFRIVCLGGSTTYTGHVEDHLLTYPALLQKRLHEQGLEHVRVINAGAMSWTTWETLINFELRVLDIDPDMVIVYHAMNDVHARLVWPPEIYQGDNSGMRAPNSGIFIPLIEHSTLIRAFLIKFRFVLPHTAIQRNIDPSKATWFGDLFQYQHVKGMYPDAIFKEFSAQMMLETNKPIYFRRNVENLITIAKARNIQVLLSTFATSLQFKNAPRVVSDEYVGAMNEMNDLVKTIGREQGVHVFDFATDFPQDKEYYADGRHVNEKGADLKARMFASYLLENRLVPDNTTQSPHSEAASSIG